LKNLILVRHAKSSWDNPNLRDFERPLNREGLAVAPAMAGYFSRLPLHPDALISSPANRALTTAGYFATALGRDKSEIIVRESMYDALFSDLLKLVSGLPDQYSTVMLFGHNPSFTNLANYFSGEFIPNVPTCGIVHIQGNGRSWSGFNDKTATVVAKYFPKHVL
jgi:phosphohistidine phosphatase